ncbi:hypothetical protein VPH49_20655 [Pseudomonas luteola]|uniref:hypothetical protein n=1 Tax=Pseudomonas luteola TaxID=47886 RepID=UPI00123A31C4|nr:hypothetical protein [Pseudomonas luteola]QEU26368.1 hypothetical protein FOB45_00685 [Pseudomonas luteola]
MTEIKEIDESIREQLAELDQTARTYLSIASDELPDQVVATITEFIRDAKETGLSLDDDMIFALGALLGNQYVRGLGWHWGDVTWDLDTAAIGVLSPDNSCFNNPIGWVTQTLESSGGVPFMLSYNMIKANSIPVFEPDSATGLY